MTGVRFEDTFVASVYESVEDFAMTKTILVFLASLSFLTVGFSPVDSAMDQTGGGDLSGGQGRKWAFCIGVGKYKDPQIPSFPTGPNDARKIAGALEEYGGFNQVVVMTTEVGEKDPLYPTRIHIQELFRRIGPKIRAEDLVLFSFFGHGLTDETGKAFFLSADSRASSPGDSAIALEFILDFLSRTGVKRSILFVDASRERKKDRRDGPAWGIYPDRYLKRGVSAIFYSAAKGYYSHDDQNSGNGIFSDRLIQGLAGDADSRYGGNGDGVVTVKELASFINLALADWSMTTSFRQVPLVEILDKGQSDLVISSSGKTKAAKTTPGRVSAAATGPVKKDGPEEKVVDREPNRSIKESGRKINEPARPDRETMESGSAVSVGAPAPGINELVTESKPDVPNEGEKAAPKKEVKVASIEPLQKGIPEREPNRETVVEEDVKIVLKERERAQKGAPPSPPIQVPQLEKAVVPAEARASEEGSGTRELEKPAQPQMSPETLVQAPVITKKESVHLRTKSKDTSVEEVKSILTTYGFYSTCWNYNGDFCNPGGDFENQFRDNGDGTVTDGATGLMWQKSGSREEVTWSGAKEYAEKMNRERFAGHSDWRLPTIEELGSLLENSWKNGDLFIDPVFDRTQRQCWSIDSRGMEAAWKANFHQGLLIDFPMNATNFVRLVRTIQTK